MKFKIKIHTDRHPGHKLRYPCLMAWKDSVSNLVVLFVSPTKGLALVRHGVVAVNPPLEDDWVEAVSARWTPCDLTLKGQKKKKKNIDLPTL